MSGAVYGGDEVGGLVFDFGTHTSRAGFAGEDVPKAVFPSVLGTLLDETAMQVDGESRRLGYRVGNAALSVPGNNSDIITPFKDGLVDDWDAFEALLNHALNDCLRVDVTEHPVIFTEPSWNTRSCREKLTELMFEKYHVPAFFMAKAPVLAAFATGRYSGIVVDIGGDMASVTPVQDGLALQKSVVKSNLGGNFLAQQARLLLEDECNIDLVPSYKIASKQRVEPNAKPDYTLKQFPNLTKSYKDYRVRGLCEDFIANMADLDPHIYDESRHAPSQPYEFPTGFSRSFLAPRYRIGEILFNPSAYALKKKDQGDSETAESTGNDIPADGIARMVQNCINKCDVDLRVSLSGSVIVTGGGTLIKNFPERLQNELTYNMSHQAKVKVHWSTMSVERKFGPWIGGSILGSLGTFQQLWVSKHDYDETGRSVVDKKCP